MADLIGMRLGEFEVARELGRGGMGVVYEAVQTSLNRRVALKVLAPGLGLTPKAVERFRREAEAAAKLHHTNIVPVYATGTEAGLHFYVMELVDGVSLDRVVVQLRGQRGGEARAEPSIVPELTTTGPYLDTSTPAGSGGSSGLRSGSAYFDAVARLTADVADALHHAHHNNIIHRDIKPSNLLLSPDGRLSVNDFGLARVLDEPGMTTTGEFMGTPAYMAPEQIAGGRIPVDHRCDVYSLGATLYELLTLRPPFVATARDQLLAMVAQKEPAAPRAVNPKVPRDLETICLKCLEKDPDRRYATARELAEDLRRYVNRFAIRARRAGPLAKLRKWVRRNPALAAAGLALLVALGAAGAFAWRARQAEWQQETDRKRQDEELRSAQRDAALEKALLLALGGDLVGAERSIGDAELLGASAGDVRLMRGQIAYYRGDLATAVEHLEQAAKWQPQRVASLALLAVTCVDFGYVERYYELLADLKTLTPVTAEDHLFKGLADALENPEQGLAAMDEAIRRRDSSVARALRARARAFAAMGTGNPSDAESAVEDARIAKAMLRENPFALAQSVFANLVAAGAYEQHGREEERQTALARAGGDAKALEKVRDLPVASTARIFYYRETGDHAAARAEAVRRRQSMVPMSVFDELLLGLELYHYGEFQEALDVFGGGVARGGDRSVSQICRCHALAELPGGPEQALAAYRRLTPSVVYEIYAPTVLQLLGRREEAFAASRAIREKALRSPTRPEWLDRMLEYNCGLLSEDEFLRAAGPSRLNQCEAHFFIGMARLAEGDRAGAREHFRRSADTHIIWFIDHIWSLAFLSRLEKDPNWPRWIPHLAPMPHVLKR